MKIDPPGFPQYGEKQLDKVNAMREAKTQPDFYGIPILHDAHLLFTRSSEMGGKPASCYTCIFKNKQAGTCALIGPGVQVEKLQRKGIEYWPCCGEHTYGEPGTAAARYLASSSPNQLGLIWINAPYPGAEYGGASCGGAKAGDDCDHYQVAQGDKRPSENGFCRVLRHQVDNGDVCCAWHDDDELPWEEAQQLLQGPQEQRDKKKFVNEIMKKD